MLLNASKQNLDLLLHLFLWVYKDQKYQIKFHFLSMLLLQFPQKEILLYRDIDLLVLYLEFRLHGRHLSTGQQ